MKLSAFISDFFQDIGNFFKSRSVLGVDIGTTSIKIAELSRRGEETVILNYGILETKEYLNHPNRVIQSSSLKISENETVGILKTLVREMKTGSRVALASIPAFAVFSTVLEMPLMSDAETQKAVDFQAPQYIPIPIKEVVIDWFKLEEYDTEHRQRYQRILLIGIPNEIIQKYKSIFKAAGLKLTALEMDGLAIVRNLLAGENNATILTDLGSETTNIFVAADGKIFYSGQTDYGGIYLTQAIAHSLGISNMRAEELKRRHGLSTEGAESELSTLTEPFLDVIIQEVNHAKSTFELRYRRKIERMILLGGGANLLGIEKRFSEQTGLVVARPNVFRKIGYDQKLEPILRQLNNELPVAIGLAQRYFIQ